MDKIYYVYTHKRLDTNDIFYVGIGTKNGGKYKCKIYHRAYLKQITNRSKFWINVYNSCNKNIEINIILEDADIEVIKQKEIELINFYGRKDLKMGNLVNLTDGGDGCLNYSWTLEQKQKRSILYSLNNPFKGKTHSEEVKKYLSEINKEKYDKGNSGICNYKTHSEAIRQKISDLAKKRTSHNKLPILKGSDNFFAKKIVAISPDKIYYLIHGGIKDFCKTYNLSYGYVKMFRNKGKCMSIDLTRARKLSKNTVGWEFWDYSIIQEELKDCDVTVVNYKK